MLPANDSSLTVSAEDLIRLRLSARRVMLYARSPATSVIAGVHASRFRGRGVDFVESRAYEVGDDIRDLDWRVTARTGKPHTKVFQEERERPVLAVIDAHPGMYFATRGALKIVQASRLAALLGWAAVSRGDRIGALICNGDDHHEVRPSGGRRGVLRMINALTRYLDGPEDSEFASQPPAMDQALKRARRIARPGSLIFLISDYYHLGPEFERHLAFLKRHSDVIACRVRDPVEMTPPPPGSYPVSNGLKQGVMALTRSGPRQRFEQFVTEQQQLFTRTLNKQGVTRLDLSTDDDVTDALGRVFKTRDVR